MLIPPRTQHRSTGRPSPSTVLKAQSAQRVPQDHRVLLVQPAQLVLSVPRATRERKVTSDQPELSAPQAHRDLPVQRALTRQSQARLDPQEPRGQLALRGQQAHRVQ